ncbi:MAG: ATP-dependent endonuclease, partial [Negativicutes bacterium]|nr:ATP-dependent endonuclease [Negativicutes bacterium]
TRARDLLLLPDQSERSNDDWFSLLTLNLEPLPAFDQSAYAGIAPSPARASANGQDLVTWKREAAAIDEGGRKIVWLQPSRHEAPKVEVESDFPVFTSPEEIEAWQPNPEWPEVQGGRERGLILHKLLEEVLTGETAETEDALRVRAAELIGQLGLDDASDPGVGPCGKELASTALAGLMLPEVAALRPILHPEVSVYASVVDGNDLTLTSGIADAVAIGADGKVVAVIDWKSDVVPTAATIELYRNQVRDYLAATGAPTALIVFVTTGFIETVCLP